MRTKPSDGTRNIDRELVEAHRRIRTGMARTLGRFHVDHGHRGSPSTCRLCLEELRRRSEILVVPTTETETSEAAE